MEDSITDKALSLIKMQKSKLAGIETDLSTELPRWRDRTTRMLSDVIIREELISLTRISGESWQNEKVLFAKYLRELEQGIKETPEFFIVENQPLEKRTNPRAKKGPSNKVFVVHGHDSLAKTEVARTIEKLGLEAIILHEQANEGKTIVEKFERDASQVSVAVVILTPDDIGYPKNKPSEQKPRARQNVILELGYFSGVLGRSNVCVLYKGEVEIPTDYLGVVYIPLDDGGSWKFNLGKELKQAGLKVDLNNLI